MFGDTSKSDDNSSSRAFFICITFKLIPDVYGERDVGGSHIGGLLWKKGKSVQYVEHQ